MAQSLKPELRARLFAVAEQAFAEAGYQGATVAAIAARAGVSTGNVYRYFANKDVLFEAVVSPEFAARFLRLLKRRVGSLLQASELTRLDAEAQADGEALLRFWVRTGRRSSSSSTARTARCTPRSPSSSWTLCCARPW